MSEVGAAHRLRDHHERVRRIEQEPLPLSIPALLEAAAAEVPDRPALHFISDGTSISYRTLVQKVNRLANGLTAIGVGPGSHVALLMANIPAWPITWLALARIGAVCVPINIRYTGRELRFAIDDAEVSHLVVADDHVPTVRTMPGGIGGLTTIVVGAATEGFLCWDDVLQTGSERFVPAREPSLDDLMNIQYTSGTTGLPKGCLLTQRYWLTCAKSHAAVDGLPLKNILANNPFFYMTPQWLTLMACFLRGTLYVASHRSGSKTMEWIRTHGIEFCLLNKIVFDQPEAALDRSHRLEKVCIYGFPKRLHADLEHRFGLRAREAFGMTEIGAGLFMPLEADFMTGSGSAGLPGPFRECRVADPEGREVAHGETGELLFRGPGLLLGYYRRPDANQDGFHGEWFRTGDLARQDADGFIYIVGRIKDMVRRAGESVAAREVEEVLAAIPGVAEAAVVPVPDPQRGEEVKAYLRLQEGLGADDVPVEAVLDHCGRNLAVFKIPRYLEYRTAEFPRTPSGKIRKAELAAEKPDLRVGSWDRVEGKQY